MGTRNTIKATKKAKLRILYILQAETSFLTLPAPLNI